MSTQVIVDEHNVYWKNYAKSWLHRIHGPAIVSDTGNTAWYSEGLLHRTDGPAVSWSDGHAQFFLRDKHYTREAFHKKIESSECKPP